MNLIFLNDLYSDDEINVFLNVLESIVRNGKEGVCVVNGGVLGVDLVEYVVKKNLVGSGRGA